MIYIANLYLPRLTFYWLNKKNNAAILSNSNLQ